METCQFCAKLGHKRENNSREPSVKFLCRNLHFQIKFLDPHVLKQKYHNNDFLEVSSLQSLTSQLFYITLPFGKLKSYWKGLIVNRLLFRKKIMLLLVTNPHNFLNHGIREKCATQ